MSRFKKQRNYLVPFIFLSDEKGCGKLLRKATWTFGSNVSELVLWNCCSVSLHYKIYSLSIWSGKIFSSRFSFQSSLLNFYPHLYFICNNSSLIFRDYTVYWKICSPSPYCVELQQPASSWLYPTSSVALSAIIKRDNMFKKVKIKVFNKVFKSSFEFFKRKKLF